LDNLRVLTFNSHQPYLHLMATSLPWKIGVVTPRFPSGAVKKWDPHIRLLPNNAVLYPSVQAAVLDDSWDWILTHNINDLLDVREISLPKVYLVHGTLSGRMIQDRSTFDKSDYIKKLAILLEASGARIVYISELKRRDWGIPGSVIRPAVEVSQYGGYRGEIRGVLQVCNNLRARGAMMGWETFQAVCRDLPNLVIGDNKDLASSRKAKDWDDLKEHLRSYRLYIYTPIYPYEDGYNLALLEAMATGMPVATLKHVTSPIRDGVEGVVGDTAEQLRMRIAQLLDDPQEARRLGIGAKARVEQVFSLAEFKNAWQDLADNILQ